MRVTRYGLIGTERYRSGKIKSYRVKEYESGRIKELKRGDIIELISKGYSIEGIAIKGGKVYVHKKSVPSTNRVVEDRGGLQVYTGESLEAIIEINNRNNFKERYLVSNIEKYCYTSTARVCILHGVRRTGKTVAMWHTINRLLNRGVSSADIVFIDASYTKLSMNEFIGELQKLNQKYLFIDEITRIKDFIFYSKMLSDRVALTKRVVLAGTESLVLSEAIKDKLYGRAEMIRTNIISFDEHLYLFDKVGLTDLDAKMKATVNYMKYGGTMILDEYRDDSIIAYDMVNTAIIGNIINTINKNVATEYAKLKELSYNQMVYLVYQYISLAVHTKDNKSLSAINDKVKDIVIRVLGDILGVTDLNSKGITGEHRREMLKALRDMDIIKPVMNFVKSDIPTLNIKANTSVEMCCMIPGLYYSIQSALVGGEEVEKQEHIGNIIENIVLQQCIVWAYKKMKDDKNKSYRVQYLRCSIDKDIPEIDIVIQEEGNIITNEGVKYSLIEVKSSNKIDIRNQCKNFRNSEILKLCGTEANRIVVYTGETEKVRVGSIDVQYINIYDFLVDIDRWII